MSPRLLLRNAARTLPPLRRLYGYALVLRAHREGRFFVTDFAYQAQVRALEDSLGGRTLQARLRAEEPRYATTLQSFAPFTPNILAIEAGPVARDATEPCWVNDWLPPLDAVSIYGLIATRAPRRY